MEAVQKGIMHYISANTGAVGSFVPANGADQSHCRNRLPFRWWWCWQMLMAVEDSGSSHRI
jgi:hypothetical protein